MTSCALNLARIYGLVLLGIGVVAAIFIWPSVLFFADEVPSAAVVTIICVHVVSLVQSNVYLYLNRKAFLPIRRFLMPFLSVVARSEATREQVATWYVGCKDGGSLPRTTDCLTFLASMKRSVRRDLKKKLVLYNERGIFSRTHHNDIFYLAQFAQLVWEHEKRVLCGTGKSPVVEFAKRFLIIFLSPDGYIDTYYDRTGRLCALHFFLQQGCVLHSCLYFCTERESRSGIWAYKHMRSILRGVWSDSVDYVNFQVHSSYAKKCAGCIPVHCEDAKMMDELYQCRNCVELERRAIQLEPDLSRLNKMTPAFNVYESSSANQAEGDHYVQINAALLLMLIYSESLMVLLHSWILVGTALPAIEQVTQQHFLATYGYLVSDMLLPILATAFSKPQHVPCLLNIFIAAHTVLYADFIFDGSRLISVMDWAYSGWRQRILLDMMPGAAVLLDAICHLGGLVILYRWKYIPGKHVAAALGVVVGAIAMINLKR
mmetsp:Transcript_32510/g.59771  ORF Transcript_32510/g.59771 Transcript_32510/m.59771 type:complete len:488 (-) Transcript_32510:6-1469(-)